MGIHLISNAQEINGTVELPQIPFVDSVPDTSILFLTTDRVVFGTYGESGVVLVDTSVKERSKDGLFLIEAAGLKFLAHGQSGIHADYDIITDFEHDIAVIKALESTNDQYEVLGQAYWFGQYWFNKNEAKQVKAEQLAIPFLTHSNSNENSDSAHCYKALRDNKEDRWETFVGSHGGMGYFRNKQPCIAFVDKTETSPEDYRPYLIVHEGEKLIVYWNPNNAHRIGLSQRDFQRPGIAAEDVEVVGRVVWVEHLGATDQSKS